MKIIPREDAMTQSIDYRETEDSSFTEKTRQAALLHFGIKLNQYQVNVPPKHSEEYFSFYQTLMLKMIYAPIRRVQFKISF